MKVAVLGTGDVAKALAAGFVPNHEVTVGSRTADPAKLQEWGDLAKQVGLKTFAEAAADAELVALAVKGDAVGDVVEAAGAANLAGKTVIDVTNPLDFSHGRPPRLAPPDGTSNGEFLQAKLPEARVVKTLNIVGNAEMVDPKYQDGTPEMLVAGEDAAAKEQVTAILKEFGWERVTDLGGIVHAREMEYLCILWVAWGAAHGTFGHAFTFLTERSGS